MKFLFDLFPIILFFIAFKFGDIYTATIVAATGPGTGGAGANANIANFSVKPGSEIAAASDYSLSTTALSFNTDPANLQLTQDVTITATQDTIAEFDEDVLIYVQSLRNATDGVSVSGGNPVAWAVVTIVYQDTPPGAIDYTYADDTIIIPQPGANNTVNATILDASGRALIGGDFTGYSATPRNRIARILTTGANDATFDPGSGANAFVSSITVYTNGVNNGRIFIGGGFTAFNGSSLNSVARLLATGAVDTSFNPGTGANGTVLALALQADGKVLLGGYFSTCSGVTRQRVARLNADGVRAPDGAKGQGAYVDGPRRNFAGGAGLVSTARDYARFLEMVRQGGALDSVRILSPKTAALMTINQSGTLHSSTGLGYGLAFETTEVFGNESVVMIASAAASPPVAESAEAAAVTPARSFSIGSRAPMTPVVSQTSDQNAARSVTDHRCRSG